jgi:signal transduction histidine kinase
MFNPSLILLILISFLTLLLGIFVLLKNTKSKLNIIFFFLSLVNILWINANYFEDEFTSYRTMFNLLKLDYSFGILFIFLGLLFCLALSKFNIFQTRHLENIILLIPTTFIALIFFTNSIISGYKITIAGSMAPVFGPGINFFYTMIFLAACSILAIIIGNYRSATKENRSQYAYLFIGSFLTIVITLLTNVILDDYLKNSVNYMFFTRLGIFSTVFIPFFYGYSIIKHRLFNIKTIAAEILSLGILLVSLTQVLFAKNVYELTIGLTMFSVLLIFVFILIRSVENEVKRKEELQSLSDQLAIANDKLRQLDKAKSEFISIASHQLRTPLTSIKGFGSLLLEGTYGSLSEPQRNALEKIYISNERLIHLVEDLLNVSRIEAGRMEFDFQEGQIEDLVQEVVDTLELSAKSKSLYLDWKKPEKPLPKIKIDIAKIKEVISNMVDNAIKYTPKGGVTVRVKLNKPQISNPESKTERGTIQVIVSDTGIGMEKEDLENIFNKFERGRGVSHYHTEGTGLGMYVGKKVVEVHKGRIWAESDGKGRGSRFILELPVDIA